MANKPIGCKNLQRQCAVLPYFVIFLFVAPLLSLDGCSARKRPNIPWATAVQVRPIVQPPATAVGESAPEAAPEFSSEVPPYAVLLPIRSGPARPRVSANASGGGSDAEKKSTPMIAPQLSPQETAAAQQETTQSLGIAEKNLAGARGRRLNALQSDMVSKINGFLKDAREALQAGDWSRAGSLAKKAEVLSEELAKSF